MVSQNDSHWVFRVQNIQARQLYLTGQFNGWLRTASPMVEFEPGAWEVAIHLQPGEYRFRYVTDDERWFTDYAAFGVVRNEFGQWDSVIYVPQAHEVARPNREGNTLAAEEGDRLSEQMALAWRLTGKGDSACGDEDDLFQSTSRIRAADRDPAVAVRAIHVLGKAQKNMEKQSQALSGDGLGMELRKRKEQDCSFEIAGVE